MPHKCACPICGTIVDDIPVTLLPERGMVVSGGKFVILTGHEMQLLQRLVEVFPRVLSRESAMSWLYQLADKEAEVKIIDVFVCKIRRKLQPLGIRIDTQWGRGYALALSEKPSVATEAA